MSDKTAVQTKENKDQERPGQLMSSSGGKTMPAPPFDMASGSGFAPLQKKPAEPNQKQDERKKGEGINNGMSISDQGLNFIIKNEGVVKNTDGGKHILYDDSEDYATIGYGHLVAKVKVSALTAAQKKPWANGLNEAQAWALLKSDALKFEKELKQHVTTELQQHEYDALVSWAFNVGGGWFGDGKEGPASAIKSINAGEFHKVGNNLGMFQKADGKFNQGVVNRRNREINVFNYGYGDKSDPFREKGDMAAPKGKDKWKEDYWGKHLANHESISKLDKLGGAEEEKQQSPADIWTECGADPEKVAAKLMPALLDSPKSVEDLLDYLPGSGDNLAYYLVSATSESRLRKVTPSLLKKLKAAMNGGWVTTEESKAMGKIDFVVGEAQLDKAKADKEKEQVAADTSALAAAKKVKNKETPLEKSVGLKGENQATDVAMVKYQMLKLNVITAKEASSNDLKVLEQLIRRYQRRIFGKYEDGLISPGGTTANRLLQGVRGVASLEKDKITNVEEKETKEKQDANKDAPSDTDAVKKLYDSVDGDSAKLGKILAEYVRTNPTMVNAMLDYEGYFYTDNLAYHIALNADKTSLAAANKELLQRLYNLMDGGLTDTQDYMIMARLAEYINGPVVEKQEGGNFDEKELDVKDYWQSQGKTPNCDIYTKKVIDGHKKDNPELYKDFGDIGSGKTKRENSFHTVWEKDWEKGTSRTDGKKNANDISTLEQDSGEWAMAIRYITACLDAGVPVMVGVNHTFAYSRAAGNNDKTTDHWLTIIGKGQDEDGKYFSYTDPGTSYEKTGTNTKLNRLYQTKDEHIWRDETKYANSDAGSGSYTLVAVTLYDKHRGKSEFKVGNESFKREAE